MGVDDSQGITVWQPSGSDDGIADVFSINVVGKQMVVMAGIGSRGCNAPDSPVKGCYRLAVARTNFPMGFPFGFPMEFQMGFWKITLPFWMGFGRIALTFPMSFLE